MQYRDERRLSRLLLLGLVCVWGCGSDDLTTPGSDGALQITTVTTGVELDPDGYTVQLDAGAAQAIGPAATVQQSDVPPGDHTVRLDGLAANCTVVGDNPRTAVVAAGETASVTFEINCQASSGGLQITTTTAGSSPDADGYSITVDGADRGTIGATGSVALEGLPAGAHEVGLSGVAGNCTVSGANPQTVTVTGGASAAVAFTVNCAAAAPDAGSIRITTATGGSDPDPNGYSVALDGGATQSIGVNSAITVTNVAAGNHSVALNGLSGNCTVQGTNPRPVAVAAGTTAEVSFAVSCTATTGSIEVRTTTTGDNPDPDGYTVSVDNGPAQSIGINATLTITGIAAGAHQVTLAGLAANCAVQGANPRQATVPAGGLEGADFAVSCSAPGGSSWTSMESGTSMALTHVSGSSATNVFAAGDQNGQMTIQHYDGTSWSTQFSSRGGVRDVWAAPDGQAFALVEGPFPGPVLHYDGSQWSSLAAQPPVQEGDQVFLHAVWGTSPTDVFVVGGNFAVSGIEQEYIAHYDGAQWSTMDLPDGIYLDLVDVWGSSPTDVYAIAEWFPTITDGEPVDPQAVIIHYDGNAWSEVQRHDNAVLRSIWGNSAGDVYAAGGKDGRAFILHYDGSSWTELPSAGLPLPRRIWTSTVGGIYATTDVFQPAGVRDDIWHFDGSAWSRIETDGPGLYDIWGSSASSIFAVGAEGTILHGP